MTAGSGCCAMESVRRDDHGMRCNTSRKEHRRRRRLLDQRAMRAAVFWLSASTHIPRVRRRMLLQNPRSGGFRPGNGQTPVPNSALTAPDQEIHGYVGYRSVRVPLTNPVSAVALAQPSEERPTSIYLAVSESERWERAPGKGTRPWRVLGTAVLRTAVSKRRHRH